MKYINGLQGKIATLQRRKSHLERRLQKEDDRYAKTASADFDMAEIAALESGIEALEAYGVAQTRAREESKALTWLRKIMDARRALEHYENEHDEDEDEEGVQDIADSLEEKLNEHLRDADEFVRSLATPAGPG